MMTYTRGAHRSTCPMLRSSTCCYVLAVIMVCIVTYTGWQVHHMPIIRMLVARSEAKSPERYIEHERCKNYTQTNTTEIVEPCCPGVPCLYKDEVDLRIIVLVYNRSDSFYKTLNSISKLKMDGDTASVDIWIDRSSSHKVSRRTMQVAKAFRWHGGPVRLHVQLEHAGIYGQWIDSWRPRKHSKELGVILEDDVDLSPYAYQWLKRAYSFYADRDDIGGISLYEGAIVNMPVLPCCSLTFLHQRIGTQGFAPHPVHWRKFQDWYHSMKNHPTFHPYVDNDPTVTGWYKMFEESHTNHISHMVWFV